MASLCRRTHRSDAVRLFKQSFGMQSVLSQHRQQRPCPSPLCHPCFPITSPPPPPVLKVCKLTCDLLYRVQTLLRFAYAHVQLMLYRPFLHYISPRLSAGRTIDDRYYACAAAGISVSRNIMHIAMEIKNQALVVGPFWTMLYTQFFAILTLVFYVLENPDKPGSAEIFADAAGAREMIAKMGPRSFAADRITKSLNTLWENLPDSIKDGKAKALPSRKRSAPGPKTGPVPATSHKTPGATAKIASAASRKGLNQRPSFDKAHRTSSQRALSMTYSDILPLNVSSTGTASDISSINPSSTQPSNPYMRNSQSVESPSIYKLDAMMFPSGDPFAYPNQPLLDYSGTVATHAELNNPSHISAVQSHQASSRNFYMPGLYGDIEGQLSKSYIELWREDQRLATNTKLLHSGLHASLPDAVQSTRPEWPGPLRTDVPIAGIVGGTTNSGTPCRTRAPCS